MPGARACKHELAWITRELHEPSQHSLQDSFIHARTSNRGELKKQEAKKKVLNLACFLVSLFLFALRV